MADITWIKLKTDMFENDKIKLIEALPDADTIIVIWVKLLAAAGKANINGYIMLTENIAMNEEEMATIFNRPLNTVRLALQTFKRYGMIEVDNDAFRIKNWENHQNIDGMERVRKLNAERNKKYRERKKLMELPGPKTNDDTPNVSVTSHDGTDKELELDIDLELEVDKELQQQKVVGGGLVDPKFAEIVKLYQDDLGPLTIYKSQELGYVYDEHGYELTLEATKEMLSAMDVNKPIKYIESILNRWKRQGVTDIQKLNNYRKRGEKHASNQSNTSTKIGDVELGF
ncbi:phage replisome organizer N-terminal domain-containing protein [Viridibacillus sp. FSL E2-0187]|uniref:phage replisome organizer N-terminal domain-containing protein n=1 Tax=Viridibacillus sp. FSL E2-0187 TaxID=2921362 RepID=UPI0030F7C4B2